MADSNPQALVQSLRETLKYYLPTALPISPNYKRLREEYNRIVGDYPLVTGPFIEALPDFEKRGTLRQLLRSSGGPVHDGLGQLRTEYLDRPLHSHQYQAMIEACGKGKSLLVATGTGSGKTECFLYPVAHRLLDDPEPGTPGVRCLIIYPMNALANDQLFMRIAPLFGRDLARFGLTFGRFTSQIAANRSRADEKDQLYGNQKLMDELGGRTIPNNWLLTREEMLANPPKILITNYAMLEHLLLLPRNAPLFAQNRLDCIVLDEIHTYAGAQATEIAYLLRKLKNRLGIQKPLQVFGTSASFPRGDDADDRIARFASNLFGESITTVLRGRRIPHSDLQAAAESPFSLGYDDWKRIGAILRGLEIERQLTLSAWKQAAKDAGLPARICELDGTAHHNKLEKVFSEAFAENIEIRRVARELQGGAILAFHELAARLFPGATIEDQDAALDAVVHAGILARGSEETLPLLPGRYHIAASCPDGFSVRLSASNPEGWSTLHPLRRYQENEVPYYSLLVCRRCGQPFLEGFEHGGRLLPRKPQNVNAQSSRRVFWLGNPAQARLLDESDSEEVELTESDEETVFVNPENGQIGDRNGIRLTPVSCRPEPDSPAPLVQTCPACGSRAPGTESEVVTPMHPGNEALGAVVVQKVMEMLPGDPKETKHPWNGRKLLAFSDNRQNAAFFAPYFEHTSFDLALRSAICQAVRASDEPLDFDLLTKDVFNLWERDGGAILIDGEGEVQRGWPKVRHLLMGKIAAEFCTPGGRRSSLEALGAVRIDYDTAVLAPLCLYVRQQLPMLISDEPEAMVRFLLETMRREKALTNLSQVDMTSPWIWGSIYATKRAFNLHPGGGGTHAWLPQEGTKRKNRRLHYILRVAGIDEIRARDFLAGFWEQMQQVKIRIPQGGASALDARALRFADGRTHTLHRCTTCGLRQHDVVQNLCTAFRCTGRTQPLSAEETRALWRENHYLRSYVQAEARVVRAREHSASLSTGLRDEIEREFAAGQVNLLSCTTTMELGVDLGELEGVVNLNLPPGIANYQQRSGRAGRRAQAAPISVTVARNAPYDQAIFRTFGEFLGKDAPIPFVRLDNATLFWRHQNSILLSHFFRDRIQNLERNAPLIQDLFGEGLSEADQQHFRQERDSWLESAAGRAAVEEAERLQKDSGIPSGTGLSGEALCQEFRRSLDRLLDVVAARWLTYTDELNKITGETAADLRRKLHWTHLREAFLKQFLVNSLSRSGLIPSYSFPVHSLSLEVVTETRNQQNDFREADVVLTRDAALGLSEYAPGAEVVANGRIWTSAGLMRSPRQFMPTEWYAACKECHHVDVAISRDGISSECGNCGASNNRTRMPRPFVSPHGFVTSYAERTGKDPGQTRRRERSADEARLLTIPQEDQFRATDHTLVRATLLRAGAEKPELCGRLFVVNRGPKGNGYWICPLCHAAEAARGHAGVKWNHRNPLNGETCPRNISGWPSDLVHSYDTDVLVLRISRTLPEPARDDGDAEAFTENCARTAAEAMRYAAAEQLQIQPSELRATYRLRGGALDVVLYDAASGGAGYCAELSGQPVIPILQLAAQNLDCPKDCATACTSCLCDYSNQNSWDQFLRKPAMAWLNELLDASECTPFAEIGAIPWASPSLRGLTGELAEADEVHLFAPILDAETTKIQETDAGAIEPDSGTLGWMLGLLNAGKRLFLHTGQDLRSKNGGTASLRRALRHFEPWLADARLRIGFLKTEPDSCSRIPRVFCDTGNRKAWYILDPLTPLFEALLPVPVFCRRGAATGEQSRMLEATRWYSEKELKPALPLERFPFEAGQPRDLDRVFRLISGAHIERLVIQDPYCAVHIGKLVQLLGALKTIVQTLERIEIRCRELPRSDMRHRSRAETKSELEQAVSRFFAKEPEIVVGLSSQARQSHDRWLQFKVVDATGSSSTHRFDLSGGIDYLMDIRSSTTVYRYEIGSCDSTGS